MANVVDQVLNWGIYVTDEGKVTCNEIGCEESEFHVYFAGRRGTIAEYLQALMHHIRLEH